MPTTVSLKKMIAVSLAATTVAVATQVGAQPGGAGAATRPAASTVSNHGNPNAVPPILPVLTPSELAAIRSAEVWERDRFNYDPPAGARYSSAVFNGYASEQK